MRRFFRGPFNSAAVGQPSAPDYGKPVSVRCTDEERAELERKAGDLTLSAYIRYRCIGDATPAHRTRGKRPVKDHEALRHLAFGDVRSTRMLLNRYEAFLANPLIMEHNSAF